MNFASSLCWPTSWGTAKLSTAGTETLNRQRASKPALLWDKTCSLQCTLNTESQSNPGVTHAAKQPFWRATSSGRRAAARTSATGSCRPEHRVSAACRADWSHSAHKLDGHQLLSSTLQVSWLRTVKQTLHGFDREFLVLFVGIATGQNVVTTESLLTWHLLTTENRKCPRLLLLRRTEEPLPSGGEGVRANATEDLDGC